MGKNTPQIFDNKPFVPKKYTGTGKDFESALLGAVREAVKHIKEMDGFVKWKLLEVSGEVGGFSGRIVFKVTIETTP